jgi:orotate phosphoribosyltransferase
MDDLEARKRITQAIARQCRKAEIIVGIAPNTIAWACWVAEALSLPAAYVRSEAKAYGKQRAVEGGETNGKRVALIIDQHDPALFIPHLDAKSVKIVRVS